MRLPDKVAGVVGGVATPFVIVAAAVLLFINPIWVGFEQGRSDVTGWTGYTAGQVTQVTGSILSDLVFGPPHFDVAVNGVRVLDSREIGHMVDVRSVMMTLGAIALLALIALLACGLVARRRHAFWRGVELGATVLLVGVVVVGAFFAVFFDQAFLLFHDLFFSPGTFSFDPSTEKLVQLFPDQFWSDTSIALAVVVLLFSSLVMLFARRVARATDEMAPATAATVPQLEQ